MSGSGDPHSVKRVPAAILLILALTAVAFLPVSGADFLGYDDPQYVTGNPVVQKGLHVDGVFWAFTSFSAANWHPLTWVSHMLDVSLFGLRPGPHHLVNLTLHAGSAALLLLLLHGVTGALWPSFLAAALFAVHPQRVESVAWISERKDVLSVFLGMITLVTYLRYVRGPRASRYLAVAAAFTCGLMAKPMLVTLPFALLLLDWWPLGRLRRAPARAATVPMSFGCLVLEKTPLLALTAASSLVTYLAQQHGGAIIPAGLFPPAARLGNAVVSYVRYFGTFFLPADLIPFYRHPGSAQPLQQVGAAALLLAGMTLVAVAIRRRRPWLLAGWLWFLGVLVPVLGLVQVGLQGMADRYSYLPAVGLSVAVVWECTSRATRPGRERAAAARSGGALAAWALAALALLGALTWRQASYWQDSVTLFTRVVAVDPKNFSGYNSLGAEYLLRGEPAKAVPFLRRSVEIWPSYQDGRYNLGLALARVGETDEAIAHFEASLRVNPRDVETLFNLAQALVRQRRFPEALQRFDTALALEQGEPGVFFARGLARAQLGLIAEAADDFGRVLALDPSSAEARENLELALRIMRGEAEPPPAAGARSPAGGAAERPYRR